MTIDAYALKHIHAIEPYVPGKPIAEVARELGLDPERIIKLASNENALGASPAARESLVQSALGVNRYPDIDCVELREALSRQLDVPLAQLIVGAGSSELILLAAHALLDATRSVVYSQYSFVSYEAAARSVGARSIVVPTRKWQIDLDAMLAAIDVSTRLVFIASPNNPTGVIVEPRELARFIAAVPENVLVVLDEAYRDFVEPERRVDVHALLKQHTNLLVLRTFSKVYGLSGLRVGYGMGDAKLISLLRRLQPPFSVNAPAQAAAVAALGDGEFVKRSIALVSQERKRLQGQLGDAHFECVPSHGNFILVRVGDGLKVFRGLLKQGIVVRPVANYGLDAWIRVTVGLPEENAAFVRALRTLLPTGTPTLAYATS